MSALVTCSVCFKNVQESNALTSLEVPGEWWICKPCADKSMKARYAPLAENISHNGALLDAFRKHKPEKPE